MAESAQPQPNEEGPTLTATTDPVAKAKSHAAMMYPDATITTSSVKGQPVVLAREDNLIRLIRLTDLDAPKAAEKPAT